MSDPNIHLVVRDDGIPPDMWEALITYDFLDGHHIYTSKNIPGLFVARLDKKEAQSLIIPSIQALFWHDKHKKVEVYRVKHPNDDDQNEIPSEDKFNGAKLGIVPCDRMAA